MEITNKIQNEYRKNGVINFLIGFLILGSLVGFENDQSLGCIVMPNPYTMSNLVFFLISITLLIGIKKVSNRNARKVLCLVELTIWIGKYFFYKGGYITGFGLTESIPIVIYDFIALGLRLMLLQSLFENIRPSKKWLIPLTLLIIFIIKIKFFSFPWYTSYKWNIQDQIMVEKREAMIGNYNGEIVDLENDTFHNIEIQIDSSNIRFLDDSFEGIKREYKLYLEFQDYASLSIDNIDLFELEIEKLDQDSLVLQMGDYETNNYILKLKRKGNNK